MGASQHIVHMPPTLLVSAWAFLHQLCCGYENAFNNMLFSHITFPLEMIRDAAFCVFVVNIGLFLLCNKIAHFQTNC